MAEFLDAVSAHSNGMELFQTVCAAIGCALSLWALLDAVKDSIALSMSGANGPRSIIATDNILGELERLIVQGILLSIGIMSVFLPPPWGAHEPVSAPELLQHTMTRFGLITITVIKAGAAIRARQRRRLFVRKISLGGFRSVPASAFAPPPGAVVSSEDISQIDERLKRKDSNTALGQKRAGE